MAGWLSSKLKEAEQLLQQIDQQAAESLGKPEKDKLNGGSKARHGVERNKLGFGSSFSQEKDLLPTKNKLEFGSELLSQPLSNLKKKIDQGPRLLNDNTRGELKKQVTSSRVANGISKAETKGQTSGKKNQLHVSSQYETNSHRAVGKDDWTELLSSPSVSLSASPAFASSVGSSDPGRAVSVKHSPAILRSKAGKGRKLVEQTEDNQLGSSSKGSDWNSVISPSFSSSNTGMFEPDQDFALHNLDEGALKRRLEIDLAELADTDIIAGVPKDLDLKKEVMNGQENVLDSATWLQEAGLKKSYEEDRKNDTRNLPHELVQPIMLEKQEKGESSLALNRITHSDGDRNENSKPNNNMTYSSTFGRDSRDLVNELNQVKSVETFMQNGSDAHEQNGVFDSPIAVDGHGLTMAHDVCKLEEHPETQASPLVEEDRYDSTSVSDDDSEEGTESEDDEEIERQKSVHKKRIAKRKELTAAREARAQAAIRERRLLVENLEKEVMSLQHILADREEQQDREASELRASIAEVMEALEREKKAHNATKMKALLLESELENQNADLARSLGAVQWELEEKISQISEVRRIISAKEAIKADLERRIAKAQGDTYSCSEIEERTKSDDTSFEEEQSELWKKIQQCQIQAKDLEVKICGLKDSWHLPTEIEKELEIRLAQLTDYLIQKQGQVEALSAEKASLLIRVETLTRNMEESKALVSSQASRNRLGRRNSEIESRFYDMEYGLDQSYDSKIKHLGHEMASSSSMTNAMIGIPLSPILRQLNSFISTALFCLRKNRRAQAFVVLYVIILHFWFWFVVFMNPKPAPTHALQELGLPNNISEMRNASLMN